MVNDALTRRVRRIYAAVGAAEEVDISNFVPQVINDGGRVGFHQDWSGDLSDEQLSNIAHSLIHNIANLQDHLKKWAKSNDKDKTKVDDAFNKSQPLQVIQDLSNNDKHGYPPRNRGYSGKSPRVGEIRRVLQLATGAEKGSVVGIKITPQGVPTIFGSGTAKVIVSGDILDVDGNNIGDLHRTALEAVQVWESVLDDFGVEL